MASSKTWKATLGLVDKPSRRLRRDFTGCFVIVTKVDKNVTGSFSGYYLIACRHFRKSIQTSCFARSCSNPIKLQLTT
jgi:hypothetical protein